MRPKSAKNAGVFIDIGQTSLKAVNDGRAISVPLERSANGRLTAPCIERLSADLRQWFGAKARGTRTAFCAVGARGVSLRRVAVPAATKDELQRVLGLQIESEFPLPPEELAWGSQLIGAPKPASNGGAPRQEILLAALKKAALEDYVSVLAGCGLAPRFTLAAFARAELCSPAADGNRAMLDIGRSQSELVVFDGAVPISIRLLSWGGETITNVIREKLSISRDDAERLKKSLDASAREATAEMRAAREAANGAIQELTKLLGPASPTGSFYLSGKPARDPELARLLASSLGGAASVQNLEINRSGGTSPAIAGMARARGKNGESTLLFLDGGRAQAAARRPALASWKWAAVATALALIALAFPSAEAIVMKPILERKLAALEADRGRLSTIDQELDFLKFLKQNQPPYLDVIYLIARSAPRGATLESLTMGRHQQVALRLKMANAAQITRFRSKLIESGWFANVIVEEQAATPDRRFSVRMTADLKPVEARKPISAEKPGKQEEEEPDFGPQPEPMMMMPPPQPASPPPSAIRPAPSMPAPGPVPDGQDGPRPPRVRRPRQMIQPDQP
jgi:Tfp pilus assembly PilM family ATPase